jgi:hypothetical protein
VTCVEPAVCNCLFSGFIVVAFYVDLMFCHCVLLDEAPDSWAIFSCVFFLYKSVYFFKVKWGLFVLELVGANLLNIQNSMQG